MANEVPLNVLNTMRFYLRYYLSTKNPGEKIDTQNLTLDELLDFWTNELKFLKANPAEKRFISFAEKGYNDIMTAIKRYL